MKKEKNKKEKKEKKSKKIVINHGITGIGTDYNYYQLSVSQYLISIIVGAIVGFVGSYIYFDNSVISIIAAVLVGINAPKIERNKNKKRRDRDLRLQFRDLLESLSNSYTVGMTASRAFHVALDDMKVEHGDTSYITRELELICNAHDNQGIEIRDMLNDFAQRSGLDDVKSFSSVFAISTNLGGDVAKVIRETRDMIGDKIETELEIQTMITGQKNQLNVLAIMPFVIMAIMHMFNMGSNGALVIVVKIIAMLLFVFAYWLGTKIVNIKV